MFFTPSLSKLKQRLQHQYDIYLQRGSSDERLKSQLLQLEALIKEKKRKEAATLVKQIESFTSEKYKKPFYKSFFDICVALGIALIAATVIRQMWFELYEIPTGSMRPTFREQDHVAVTKTAYGLNIPLVTDHFYFDPSAIHRGGVVIFSGDGLDLSDTDSTFLYLFPYKKRYIKRLIGKPGDTLYFYGGRIYGLDKEGHPIHDFEGADWIQKLEYIPFNTFEGKVGSLPGGKLSLKQMNQEVARLSFSPLGDFQGELLTPEKGWIKESASSSTSQPATYTDLWGMGNYGKSRIVADKEGKKSLEIYHHPSLSQPAPRLTRDWRGYSFSLTPQVSLLPLDDELLQRVMDSLYTARFVIKGGKASRYQIGQERFGASSPRFDNVPDGTYEFYYGKGYRVGWGGTLSELSSDHPLMSRSPDNIVKLYNLGIELDLAADPSHSTQPTGLLLPSRYVYYRDGDLYLMGAPLLKKGDPRLSAFEASEKKKADAGSYLPFLDKGIPSNPDFFKAFGLKIPEKHYLVLGDNHAMSGDSRFFGFVPEENLQGAPSWVMWPFGSNWGYPSMVPYALINPSRLIVWTLALLALGIWWYLHHKRQNRPIK